MKARRVKLLLYSDSFAPSVGGIERITLELATGIANRRSATAGSEEFNLTVVTQTPSPDDRSFPFEVIRRPSLKRLSSLIRNADLVHLAGPAMLPLLLALLHRRRVVIEHHGFQAVCPNGQLFFSPEQKFCEGHYMAGRYAECLKCNKSDSGFIGSVKQLMLTPVRRWLSKRASVNIVPTHWLSGILGVPRMHTVYHGISVIPERGSDVTGARAFAYQGRLVSTKGASLILEAAQVLRDRGVRFSLKIIGDGPERQTLEKMAQPLGDCVNFLGNISDEDLSVALSEVSTVIAPSVAGEVFGLVVAENMLRGKLLILSDIGPFKELIGEVGVLVPAGDASSLANAMQAVLEAPSVFVGRRLGAQARAESLFATSCMVDSHAAIYLKLTQGGTLSEGTNLRS
jgi:glycogen(starch) synthase